MMLNKNSRRLPKSGGCIGASMKNRRDLLTEGGKGSILIFGGSRYLVFCLKKTTTDSIFNSALGVTYLGNENRIGELLNIAFP